MKMPSIPNFALMNVIFIFFLALAGHASLRATHVKSTYHAVLHATFYLYGPIPILVALAVGVWFQAMTHSRLSYWAGLLFLIGLLVWWACRSWSALTATLGGTRRQAILSFLVANLLYQPIMYAFWAISGFLGNPA
jgi:hypothetical protein